MSKKPYDPLSYLPSAEAVRQRLTQTERLAKRLRILLRVAEEIERTEQPQDDAAEPPGVPHEQ